MSARGSTDGPRPKHVQLSDVLADAGDPRARARSRDPVGARADDDVRRLARHGAQGHREPGRRRAAERIHGKGTFVARPRVQTRLHLASFSQDMRRRGLTPSTRAAARRARSAPPPEVVEALGLRRTRHGLAARPRAARRRPADGDREGLVPALRSCPASTAHDLSGSLYELFAEQLRPGHRRCRADPVGRGGRRGATARRLDAPVAHPLLVFRRVSAAGGPPLEYVVSRYRGDRYQIHMSLGRAPTPPGSPQQNSTTRREDRMTTADAASGGTASRRRLNLAPVQKFGRSLMLPIAALPVAALLLRLGQPDLLGADGLGWDQRRRRHRRRRQRALRQPAAALRRRRRDRHGEEGGRLDGAGRRRRLPRLQGRRRRDVAVRPRLPPKGEDQELINYGVLGGIVMGLIAAYLWQRYHRISLPPYLAFFGGRRFVPIITAFAAIVIAVLMSFVYPAFDAGITSLGEWVADNAVHRRLRLRHAEPAADPARPAPHPQQPAVVHPRRVHTPAARPTTATSPASSPATRPRAPS